MEQTLVVGRQAWPLFGQIPKSLSALLLCWISQVRLAGSRDWRTTTTLQGLDGVWRSRTGLSSQSTTGSTSRHRSFPGLASHPGDAVTDAIGWRCKLNSLERRYCRVLQVGHICPPEVVVHLFGERRPQLQFVRWACLLVCC